MRTHRLHGPPTTMIAVVAFVVTVVAAILAIVSGLDAVETTTRDYLDPWLVLVLGLVTLVAGYLIWIGLSDLGGALAIACGIGFIILWPENAGLFALVGGVTALVATRLTRRTPA